MKISSYISLSAKDSGVLETNVRCDTTVRHQLRRFRQSEEIPFSCMFFPKPISKRQIQYSNLEFSESQVHDSMFKHPRSYIELCRKVGPAHKAFSIFYIDKSTNIYLQLIRGICRNWRRGKAEKRRSKLPMTMGWFTNLVGSPDCSLSAALVELLHRVWNILVGFPSLPVS